MQEVREGARAIGGPGNLESGQWEGRGEETEKDVGTVGSMRDKSNSSLCYILLTSFEFFPSHQRPLERVKLQLVSECKVRGLRAFRGGSQICWFPWR